MLVHNDLTYINDVNQKWIDLQFPNEHIERLIAFALDLTRFVLKYLDDRVLGTSYANTTDLEALMYFADVGLKYRDEYVSEMSH